MLLGAPGRTTRSKDATNGARASLPMSTTYFWFRVTVPLLGPDLLKQAFFNHDDPHGIWVNTFNKAWSR